jgi:hypothetical protein
MGINGIGRMLVSRKFFYVMILVVVGIYVARDYSRLNRDYDNLVFFLDNVRLVSGRDHKSMMVSVSEKNLLVREAADMPVIAVYNVPTLSEMRYASDMGDNVILFYDGAIDERRHTVADGFIRLKSLAGFEKMIRINERGETQATPHQNN